MSQFENLPNQGPERPLSSRSGPVCPQVRTWPTNPENVALYQGARIDTHFTALSGPLAKERRASWRGAPQGLRGRSRAGRRARPPVGRGGPPEGPNRTCGGRRLPPEHAHLAPTSRGAPRHPGGPLRPMKWVSIRAGWYYDPGRVETNFWRPGRKLESRSWPSLQQ